MPNYKSIYLSDSERALAEGKIEGTGVNLHQYIIYSLRKELLNDNKLTTEMVRETKGELLELAELMKEQGDM